MQISIKGGESLINQKGLCQYLLVIWFALLVGCSPSYDFATDGPFVTTTVSPGGPDDYRNLISETIAIYDDGTLILSSDGETETAAPIYQTELTKDEIEQLKTLIIEEDFFKLDNDITTPSEDGAKYSITVFLTDQTKKVSGWNPDNEHFHTIRKHILKLVNQESRSQWSTEMSEYVWETDALSRYDIGQYNEGGPFLSLMIENPIPTEYYYDQYYQEMTLDLDGNLKIIAKAYEDHETEIKEIEPLELTVSDESIAHIQHLIKENFWKLNEVESNYDGKFMEYMTVYLSEASKTVSGYEPDNPRYTTLKEAIFKLIPDDLLKAWDQQVLEHFDQANEEEVTEYLESFDDELLYDIAYIFKAPKTREKNVLSKVIKIAFVENNDSEQHIIGLEIDREVIHIEPWMTSVGILSLEEKEKVEAIEDVIDILEKYRVQNWQEDYTHKDVLANEDGYSWSLWIQFEDGTVEKHGGSWPSKKDVIPENFSDFADALKEFVETKLDE